MTTSEGRGKENVPGTKKRRGWPAKYLARVLDELEGVAIRRVVVHERVGKYLYSARDKYILCTCRTKYGWLHRASRSSPRVLGQSLTSIALPFLAKEFRIDTWRILDWALGFAATEEEEQACRHVLW